MKKKVKILIIVLLVIAIVSIGIISVIINNKKKQSNGNNVENEYSYEIKSTRKNPITKDDIEVKDIKLFPSDTTIKLEIDLKNKSSKDIVGFNIEVELLDESDKRITVISLNTEDTIPAKKEYSFTAFSTIDKSQNKNIKKARIVKIDKNSNDYFDEFQKLDIE